LDGTGGSQPGESGLADAGSNMLAGSSMGVDSSSWTMFIVDFLDKVPTAEEVLG
jgi:hypothetical protein